MLPRTCRSTPTGSSMIRFEMAYGKAYAALAMGRSSKLVKVRAEEKPIFMRYLQSATGDQIFPEGGGMQIRNEAGEVIGAVGVTGDTEDPVASRIKLDAADGRVTRVNCPPA